MVKHKLSVVIVAKNEAEMLSGCLESVKWADEIVVVVDQATTDATEEIARKVTDRVYSREFDGFANQKNFAIDQATGDLILILDADERVSMELKDEIQKLLSNAESCDYYQIPRESILLGKKMRFGGWSEQHVRLIKRGAIRYSNKQVHEVLELSGTQGQLNAPIIHITHRSIKELLSKTDFYTEIEAKELFAQSVAKVSLWTLWYKPIKFFAYYYIWLQGFRDGIVGLIEVVIARSYYQFLVYAKIWELQQQKEKHGSSLH